MKLDSNGLIVQQDGDGGDTAAREGEWFTLTGPSIKAPFFSDACRYLMLESGLWIRHPKYPLTSDFSRDQDDPMIIACGEQGGQYQLWIHFRRHIKRAFVYQNGDAPMLTTPCLYIRAFRWWWCYPILLILDIAFMFCFVENYFIKSGDDVDDNNCILRFIQALRHYPTPWSYFGRRLYATTRPLNNGNVQLGEKNPVMGAIAWYHREASGGNPDITEAYRPIVLEYFS